MIKEAYELGVQMAIKEAGLSPEMAKAFARQLVEGSKFKNLVRNPEVWKRLLLGGVIGAGLGTAAGYGIKSL